MAYPPTVPVNSRANGTATFDNHPADHNAISNALTDIINELGSGPKGGSADLTARLAAMIPPGTITMYGAAAAPSGYLLCDGSAVSMETYAALYAVVGVTYGDPGGGDFNLPNLKDRFPVGKGVTTPHIVLGETGGSANTTLVSHTHPVAGTVSGTTSLAHGHSNGTVTGTTNIDHNHAAFASATATEVLNQYDVEGGAFAGIKTSTTLSGLAGTSANVVGHAHTVDVPALGTTNIALASGVATIPSQGATSTALSNGTLNGGTASASTTPAGGSATNTNLPPYLTVNFIIKT